MAETGSAKVHLLFVTFIRTTKKYFGQPTFGFRLSDGQPENFLKNQACKVGLPYLFFWKGGHGSPSWGRDLLGGPPPLRNFLVFKGV